MVNLCILTVFFPLLLNHLIVSYGKHIKGQPFSLSGRKLEKTKKKRQKDRTGQSLQGKREMDTGIMRCNKGGKQD